MKWILMVIMKLTCFSGSAQLLSGEVKNIRNYSGKPANGVQGNPAVLGWSERFKVALHAENTFFLLPAAAVTVSMPVPKGGFGLTLLYHGTPLHSEGSLSIAYGRNFGSNVLGGLGFSGRRMSIPGYIRQMSGEINAGFLIRLNGDIVTGMDIRKQVVHAYGERKNIFRAGIGYSPGEVLLVAAEVTKSDQLPPQLFTGCNYRMKENVMAMLGFTTNGCWWLGTGYSFASFTAEAVFTCHPQLGWTPSLSLTFQKKKNESTR